jgi:hypothetical protein
MSDKVWIVQSRVADSYEGFSSNYETISLHKTEDGAKKMAESVMKDNAVSALSGGNTEDHKADPDAIVGAVQSYNEDLGSDLKTRLAKPEADLMTVIFQMLEDHGIDYADTEVSSLTLRE